MTGPKLQKAEILLKFRERSIAIGADIVAMFSRIRLTEDDADRGHQPDQMDLQLRRSKTSI